MQIFTEIKSILQSALEIGFGIQSDKKQKHTIPPLQKH